MFRPRGSPSAHGAKRIELVAGTDHGVALPDRSPAIRALLEQFVRDPAATVAG